MAKPLMEVLGQIRGGAAVNDAAKDFLELCQRVRATGKPGSLTLTIKVNPDKNDFDVYEVTPDVTVKLPKVARAKGLFYMTPDAQLVREDPKQAKLEFEDEKVSSINEANLARLGRGND